MNGTSECPLANVERRLEDAGNLWRKASDAYFEPSDFRLHLQASIQAFRSVTWILQSNKNAIKDFDNWYSNWQNLMRADPILRWLVEARNKIEKQGDLDAKSKLKATVSGSWFDSGSLEKELPPETRPKDIGHLMVRGSINEEALVKVERRWVDSNLPDSEILDALCHCHLTLRKLMSDAHSVLGSPSSRECSFFNRATKTNEELPEFMLNSQRPRVIWVRLKDGTSVSLQQNIQTFSRNDSANEEARKRYGFNDANVRAFKNARTFREECAAWFQHSKRMLEVDSYLIPTALVKTGKGMQLFQFRMNDRADKHIMLRDLADSCKRLDAIGVMFINEAWVAPAKFAITGRHAIDCPDRGEAIVLHGLKQNGEAVCCLNIFTRREGRIYFGEDEITEGDVPSIMAPFVKVWKIESAR